MKAAGNLCFITDEASEYVLSSGGHGSQQGFESIRSAGSTVLMLGFYGRPRAAAPGSSCLVVGFIVP